MCKRSGEGEGRAGHKRQNGRINSRKSNSVGRVEQRKREGEGHGRMWGEKEDNDRERTHNCQFSATRCVFGVKRLLKPETSSK